MSNYYLIAKNPGLTEIYIQDLGVAISASGERQLVGPQGSFSKVEVLESLDLKPLVQAGTLVINNGSEDLSIADGSEYIQVLSKYEDTVSEFSDLSTFLNNYLASISGDFVFSNVGNVVSKEF